MKKLLLGLFLIFIGILESKLNAQCEPPSADRCDSAKVLCPLSVLNGYCCQNPKYNNPTGCRPLCPSGGGSHNTGWWAFVSKGGQVNITISVSNCSVNWTGLQIGIWGDCSCIESIICDPDCIGTGSYTLSGNLQNCKNYYLFIDGCNGDVCDFCLTTTLDLPPILPPLSRITGPKEVCVGACNVKYKVDLAGTCESYFEWLLDGHEIGNGSRELSIDFPDSGEYYLVVILYMGNPHTGYYCADYGAQYIIVNVKPEKDRIGPTWYLCHEDVPFTWHGIVVDSAGEYRQRFTDRLTCCTYDSIRQFVVLDVPKTGMKYFVGCDSSDAYIDPNTRQTFNTCQHDRLINIPNTTSPYRCDSSYFLNAVFLNYNTIFREFCDSGRLQIEARVIDRTLHCGNDSVYMRTVRYRWYLKSDSTKATLDTQAYLVVERKDDYCLELLIDSEFGDQKKKCSFTFCEVLDESDFLPYEVCMLGNFGARNGDSAHYSIDTILKPTVGSQTWTVEGGIILTRDEGKDTSDVLVLWDDTSSVRMICYQYSNECGLSKKCCKEVKFISSVREEILKPEDINLVPNPVSHTFRLITKSDLKIKSLQLFDLQGRPIQTWTQNFSEEFDLSAFTNGIYHVRIHAEQGTIHKKIVLIK